MIEKLGGTTITDRPASFDRKALKKQRSKRRDDDRAWKRNARYPDGYHSKLFQREGKRKHSDGEMDGEH